MSAMRLDVVSLAPESFAPLTSLGVIGRAFNAGIAELHTHNPRDHASDRYRKVDDQPYGGGAGMVLKPEPVFAAFESIPVLERRRVLLLSPQGQPLRQADLQRWAREHDQLVLLCGHYEGFDERIRNLADEEVSLGDFVLTGGELAAMVLINGVVRLLPGTVGCAESLLEESHSSLLLEHPHYTRPAEFRGLAVPQVLRSGDHGAIARWRAQQQQERTKQRRPDLHRRWREQQSAAGLEAANLQDGGMQMRIGNGYDIHRLVPGRPLILGGQTLEHPAGLGLDGHSDADVLVHALMDALLGALSLGDIGQHFPPDDERWRGADSLVLLEQVMDLVRERGWQVVNVDTVVVAERPKLRPHIAAMRAALSQRMGLNPDQVGIKATTNETLGPTGREEGIACHAVALLAPSGDGNG
ncbi:tRNA (guanosine(37)-N1)-methyltransferase TrmD [Synechococcus sp. Cruz-9H2]|uniref:tRNA (guanosine(37)-N1)-methyltransferase TrmD n=1 Tax=unclassified Synechococcus TaxID=2626047 RepID=UPI0020CDA0F8|nr:MULTISPECIES: tRNA (guanosine(37)-N1)-methyltransferase TrmD [unclassified Synechococcus]MCP9819235.1 tRNA (guanosine(37)-N1)-methyltransferase TrmD [Synechococcus sp. Cruz-9H2]MCP9843739.1 tRNA (guanosine(37)-N1)-methyltransferase TrmD [Synechococcus sp. Edmonson 11F2]MCP9855542.1 tRNA (guanosine(37)-N1)-methyltransferase TrmD [Synechococcus sp. Cruz-9C9]MCP9862980.1 tRNA (guanosine(37)-N1)-methyltransferase TrmD [Synechococcus sp. Cruz-7E5]MCP9870145.1 tRNA (guanosine(37)-N1)-methyltransf